MLVFFALVQVVSAMVITNLIAEILPVANINVVSDIYIARIDVDIGVAVAATATSAMIAITTTPAETNTKEWSAPAHTDIPARPWVVAHM